MNKDHIKVSEYQGVDIKAKIEYLLSQGYLYDEEMGEWYNENVADTYLKGITKHMIETSENLEKFVINVNKIEELDRRYKKLNEPIDCLCCGYSDVIKGCTNSN